MGKGSYWHLTVGHLEISSRPGNSGCQALGRIPPFLPINVLTPTPLSLPTTPHSCRVLSGVPQTPRPPPPNYPHPASTVGRLPVPLEEPPGANGACAASLSAPPGQPAHQHQAIFQLGFDLFTLLLGSHRLPLGYGEQWPHRKHTLRALCFPAPPNWPCQITQAPATASGLALIRSKPGFALASTSA